jgi:hypothetical protein
MTLLVGGEIGLARPFLRSADDSRDLERLVHVHGAVCVVILIDALEREVAGSGAAGVQRTSPRSGLTISFSKTSSSLSPEAWLITTITNLDTG